MNTCPRPARHHRASAGRLPNGPIAAARWLKSMAAAALALAALAPATALAGTLRMTVTDKDGAPAANVVVLVHSSAAAPKKPPAEPVLIEQKDLQFVPFLTVVPVGATVRFTNRDPYDHHIRSVADGPLGSIAPAKNFELRLNAASGAPEKHSEITVDQPGLIGLGCHLHSSMRGHLYVTDTPWFGKTDASGVAVLDGLPNGPIDVKLWHPDQLSEQAEQKQNLGAAPLQLAGQLNFTPRRRR